MPILRVPALALALHLPLWLMPAATLADWLPNGTAVGETYYLEQWPFTAIADGAGGVIVGWGSLDLRASRLTQAGDVAPGWPAGGARLQGYPHDAFYPLTVSDGDGGAYVVFNAQNCLAHCALDPTELRAQHVTAAGAIADGWGTSGVSVGSGFGPDPKHTRDYGNTVAIPDAHGGVIVLWASRVNRDGGGPVELRAQRIDDSGALLWGATGTLVRSMTRHPFLQAGVADGQGGAFVFWQDERSRGLFAQHLSREGAARWTVDGIPIARPGFTSLSRPVAITDGARGAIVAWVGAAARDSGIFATRVNAGGGLPWQEPVRVHAAPWGIDSLRMIPLPGGGAILAWRDTRRATGETIFAQRIGHDGKVRWTPGAVPVCVAPGHKDYLALAPDGGDGAFFAWGDTRPAGEVFAMHLDGDGAPVDEWVPDGSPVCAPLAAVWSVQLVADGSGGAIVVWTDDRVRLSEGFWLHTTRAMRLESHGPVTPPVTPGSSPVAACRAMPAQVPSGSSTFGLRGMRPNPGRRGSLVDLALADAAPASLELFDAAGRRLWTRDVGGLGAGEHAIRIGDGAWLPPGLYLARLVQGERVSTAHLAIIR